MDLNRGVPSAAVGAAKNQRRFNSCLPDCVRGLFLSSINYVGDEMYSFVGGGR
jgi:hypothetical protein